MFLQLGTLFLSHLCFKRDVRVAGTHPAKNCLEKAMIVRVPGKRPLG